MPSRLSVLLVLLLSVLVSACAPEPQNEQLRIAPANVLFSIGSTFQLTAELVSGMTSRRVEAPDAVQWSSENPRIVTVSSTGLLTGIDAGETRITATLMRPNRPVLTATVSVISEGGAPRIPILRVTPPTTSVVVGQQQRFTAAVIYESGTQEEVPATWTSSDSNIVTINAQGEATGQAVGTSTVSAMFMGMIANATITVTRPPIVALTLSPVTASLSVGETTTLTVTAIRSDGSQEVVNGDPNITWQSSNPMIATVQGVPNAGLVTAGNTDGSATITARLGSVLSSPAIITTRPDNSLMHLTISPTLPAALTGQTMVFRVVAVYRLEQREVTARAMFTSSMPRVAEPVTGRPNEFRCRERGTTTIRATFEGMEASTHLSCATPHPTRIVLTPNVATVAAGTTVRLQATIFFDDGSEYPLTTQSTWESSVPTVASVDRGVVTGLARGATFITASAFGVRSTPAPILVTDAEVTSLTIQPNDTLVGVAGTQFFRAQATFTDGTSQDVSVRATWSSSSPSIATVSTYGQVVGVSRGIATITARFGGFTATATARVEGFVPVALELSPSSSVNLAVGATQAFTATLRLTDGTSQNVTRDPLLTWSSSNPSFVSISNRDTDKGTAQALLSGTATIQATYRLAGGVSVTSAPVTVSVLVVEPRLLRIAPSTAVLAVGYVRTLRAELVFADGSVRDLTTDSLLQWRSNLPSVATVGTTGPTAGLVRALSSGAVTISATYGTGAMALSATSVFTINNATLRSLSIEPTIARLRTGAVANFRAFGTFSDGSNYDITESVRWSMASSWNPLFGTLSDAEGNRGRFVAGNTPVSLDVGNAVITATRTDEAGFAIASATASVELTAAP